MAVILTPLSGDSIGGLVGGLSASGVTGPFQLRSAGAVFLSCQVTAITAGGQVQMFLDLNGPDNGTGSNWVQVATLPAQSAVGAQAVSVAPATILPGIAPVGRLRWTLSGAGAQVNLAAFAAALG